MQYPGGRVKASARSREVTYPASQRGDDGELLLYGVAFHPFCPCGGIRDAHFVLRGRSASKGALCARAVRTNILLNFLFTSSRLSRAAIAGARRAAQLGLTSNDASVTKARTCVWLASVALRTAQAWRRARASTRPPSIGSLARSLSQRNVSACTSGPYCYHSNCPSLRHRRHREWLVPIRTGQGGQGSRHKRPAGLAD